MSLTWKDGLATALVGAAAALYLLWVSDTTVAGLTGIRALTVAVFALGVGGCYAARSEMAAVYGAGGGPRPPLLYVVLATILGGVTLVAGIVAFAGGGDAALATLTGAMVALWALATIRRTTSRRTPQVIRVTHAPR